MPSKAGVQHGGYGREQIAQRFLHATDVGLANGIAIRVEAPCQFGLGEGASGFLLVKHLRPLDGIGAFDKGEAATEFIFG